jgi:anti-sigma factor RsiW
MVAAQRQPASATAPTDQIADVSDAKAVQAELSRRLGRAVPLPELSASGWQLKDAALVSIRSHPAARFDFDNAGRRITLFSVPIKAFHKADENDTYDVMSAGHAISGYVAKGGVHCLVGDAGMPIEQITELRKKLQSL